MSDDIYYQLRDFLDNLPGGYPTTETGVEIRILKKLFEKEHAEICVQLTPMPSSVTSIARKLKRDEKVAAGILEDMAQKGLLFRVRSGDAVFYAATSFVVGIYEFSLNRLDKEFSLMMDEYLPYIGKQWSANDTKQFRVIPVSSSIQSKSEVATYDKIYTLIKNVKRMSVSECICAKERGILGHRCEHPKERCVQFGTLAEYFIDNKMARPIDQFELIGLLKMGEENGLVLAPMNVEELTGFCMCCNCCCSFLNIVKLADSPATQTHSSFSAEINANVCISCGTCDSRCHMDAIDEGHAAYEVDKKRCIGCGLCIQACPDEAITLVKKEGNVRPPPRNLVDMNMRIAKERGILK